MCVFKGAKTFAIVPPADRKFLYTGTKGYPENYSPIEFFWPETHYKFPLFEENARLKFIHINEGDCMFLPAYYWHQVDSA